MKRKHKIIAFIFSILGLVLSIAMYKTSMENRKIHKMEKEFMIEIINDLENELKEKESEENELTTDIIEDNNITSENDSSSDDNTSKNNMEINNAPNTNVVKENKNNTNNTTTTKPKEEKKTEQSNTPPVQEQPTKPKEKTAWEELGISEYDYYHKPMWSWATVTYSIETYGSQAEARRKCEEDCNNSGKDCRCIIVNSYSGDYLGEYLKIYD